VTCRSLENSFIQSKPRLWRVD